MGWAVWVKDFSFFLPAPPRGWRARSLGILFGDGIRHLARSATRSVEYLLGRITECRATGWIDHRNLLPTLPALCPHLVGLFRISG